MFLIKIIKCTYQNLSQTISPIIPHMKPSTPNRFSYLKKSQNTVIQNFNGKRTLLV